MLKAARAEALEAEQTRKKERKPLDKPELERTPSQELLTRSYSGFMQLVIGIDPSIASLLDPAADDWDQLPKNPPPSLSTTAAMCVRANAIRPTRPYLERLNASTSISARVSTRI